MKSRLMLATLNFGIIIMILLIGFLIGFFYSQSNPWTPDIYDDIEVGDMYLFKYYLEDDFDGEVKEQIISSFRMEEYALKQSYNPSVNGFLDWYKKITISKLENSDDYKMIDFRLSTPPEKIKESWSDCDRTLEWSYVTPLHPERPNDLKWGEEMVIYNRGKTSGYKDDYHITEEKIKSFLN